MYSCSNWNCLFTSAWKKKSVTELNTCPGMGAALKLCELMFVCTCVLSTVHIVMRWYSHNLYKQNIKQSPLDKVLINECAVLKLHLPINIPLLLTHCYGKERQHPETTNYRLTLFLGSPPVLWWKGGEPGNEGYINAWIYSVCCVNQITGNSFIGCICSDSLWYCDIWW